MAWITSIPGPSLVATPITLAFGPVVSYNVLAMMAPAVSAWTAYVLFKHITGSFWPAFAGGYFFGFSTYEIGHTLGHLNLTLVFLIPLAVLMVVLHLEGRLRARWFVVLLAVVLAVQFLISTEVLLSMTGFGAAAMALAALLMREARQALKNAVINIGFAYLLSAALVAPMIVYVLVQGIPKAPLNPPFFFSADVLNFVIPTEITWLGGSLFRGISDRFTGGAAGTTAYLGLPLIGAIVLFASSEWRRPLGKLLTILLALIMLASLGNRLHVAGITRIRLPWTLFAHLPVVENALPVRFTMYAFLVAGAMVALWLARGSGWNPERWGVVALSAVFLLPNVSLPLWSSSVEVPKFFRTALHDRYLTRRDNVLILPLGTGEPMIWQAAADFSFRMAGGFTGPGPPHYIRSSIVHELWKSRFPNSRSELTSFLRARRVTVVILREGSLLEGRISAWLGIPPVRVGEVLHYRVVPSGPRRAHARLIPSFECADNPPDRPLQRPCEDISEEGHEGRR